MGKKLYLLNVYPNEAAPLLLNLFKNKKMERSRGVEEEVTKKPKEYSHQIKSYGYLSKLNELAETGESSVQVFQMTQKHKRMIFVGSDGLVQSCGKKGI